MTAKPHRLTVNDKAVTVTVEAEMPLLWALRDGLGILGPKFGCGVAACGACTVLISGEPVRSCSIQVGDVKGPVTTIDGLAEDGRLHAVQEAWIAEGAPQCGYCQAGQIMSAVALLARVPNPNDKDIDDAMSGNLCRCGAYQPIRRAIARAASSSVKKG
jgi:isoquinoline 1-oxidoreductase subunit alpha